MSMGPLDAVYVGSAGLVSSHARGGDEDRNRQQVGADDRRVYYGQKAEAAAGVGELDGQDHQADEREADGRRPWSDLADARPPLAGNEIRPSKDPAGLSGQLLDLIG